MAKRKMSLSMQKAAVKAAQGEGSSLDTIEKDHPELKDGVAAIRKQSAAPATPEPARSGSTSVRTSMTRPPTL